MEEEEKKVGGEDGKQEGEGVIRGKRRAETDAEKTTR